MRKIKFRAWDKQAKKMIYSDKVYPSSMYKFEFDILSGFDFKLMKMVDRYNVTDNEGNDTYQEVFEAVEAYVMQNTGLKDMNDKEIYEGDIVKIYDVQTGKLSESTYPVICNSKSEWTIEDYYLLSRKHHKCKVIGNIYENNNLVPTQMSGPAN